jgi:hypothetical protein
MAACCEYPWRTGRSTEGTGSGDADIDAAAPGEGIWQTVDARVRAGPGSWTTRGENRSSEGDLLRLKERLNRDVATSRYSREPLLLVAVGVLGRRPGPDAPLQNRRMAMWVLTNLTWPAGPAHPPKVVSAFRLEGEWVDEPRALPLGSGRVPVLRSPSDMALPRRSFAHCPNKPSNYLGLLAAVNRRAARGSHGTVSPWCSGTYMPELGQGLEGRMFSERGDPEPPSPSGLASILFGVDLTDSTRQLQLRSLNEQRGCHRLHPLSSAVWWSPGPEWFDHSKKSSTFRSQAAWRWPAFPAPLVRHRPAAPPHRGFVPALASV